MQMSWYTTRLWRKRILKKKWRSSQIITNSFTYSRWTHADSSKCIIRLELVSTEIAAVSHWVKQKRGDQSFIHRETTSALWFIFLSNFFFRFWNTFFGLPRCALDERCSVSKATERESMIIEYKLLHTHTHTQRAQGDFRIGDRSSQISKLWLLYVNDMYPLSFLYVYYTIRSRLSEKRYIHTQSGRGWGKRFLKNK